MFFVRERKERNVKVQVHYDPSRNNISQHSATYITTDTVAAFAATASTTIFMLSLCHNS